MPLTPGQILNNRYRIVKLLGQGGFGAVYRAWDTNLDEPVALKESFETSPSAQKQFQLEAKLLFRLMHPNLPRVHDTFVILGQGMYLVMDYIEGEDLGAILQKASGPLPEAQVLPWIMQVCDALEYLHSQNPPIIHRDIKPGNIKITPQGKAMLVDFGIAKVYDPYLSTTAAARAITPGYSPQEQYGMGATDARTDVYALGATLYHLLTGKQPPESIQRNLGAQVEPPLQLNPRISPTTGAAIARALEMLPEKRWQSVMELKRALTYVQAPINSVQVSAVQAARFQTQPAPAPAQPVIPRLKLQISNLQWVGVLGALLVIVLLGYLFSNGGDGNKQATQTALAGAIEKATADARPTRTHVPSDTPDATSTPDFTETPTPTETLLPIATPTFVEPEMILIPAGEFQMGLSANTTLAECNKLNIRGNCNRNWFLSNEPVHTVYLDDYYIDLTEVTTAMYSLCGQAGVCAFSGTGDNYPMVYVEWVDAKTYCEWRGARLPTEAEWEKAARGTDGRLYPWGNTFDGSKANFCDKNCDEDANENYDDGYNRIAPVGSYPQGASPYGVLDMAGNVWEWVMDWYQGNYYASQSRWANPFGPDDGDGNVVRGGSWGSQGHYLLTAYRDEQKPESPKNGPLPIDIGFRCARSR